MWVVWVGNEAGCISSCEALGCASAWMEINFRCTSSMVVLGDLQAENASESSPWPRKVKRVRLILHDFNSQVSELPRNGK